jgi:rfaE bifunctional protein nucleotidyltransferase chain/domain
LGELTAGIQEPWSITSFSADNYDSFSTRIESELSNFAMKITNISSLKKILEDIRSNKKIVLCHGCFDLLHIGHIRYFQQAKEMGDILAVTISPDRFVDKGLNRPTFSEKLRADAIASLAVVDYVAVNAWPTAVETLELLKPDIYVKGADFKSAENDPTGKLGIEAEVCERLGIELRFTEDVVFSSTNLINRFFSSFPDEVQEYLNLFRKRYSLEQIIGYLEEMRKLKILLAGDAIIDEYCYGSLLGASSKSPTLALKYDSADRFAGGVLAIANHLAGFCGSVELFTVIGGVEDNHRDFIEKELLSSVKTHFFIHPNAPTTLKRRFLDGHTFVKLLEIYEMDDSGLPCAIEKEMRKTLLDTLPKTDMTIAADFGHGAISPRLRRALCESEAFLSVSTPANAGNKRMHTISSYSRADYISISSGELILDTRDQSANMRNMVMSAAAKFKSKLFVTTLGRKGACAATHGGTFVESPAFVSNAIDTEGSGDAFFAISSMAARIGVPDEVVIFLGNAAGAIACHTLGNKKPITRRELEKFVTSLLK